MAGGHLEAEAFEFLWFSLFALCAISTQALWPAFAHTSRYRSSAMATHCDWDQCYETATDLHWWRERPCGFNEDTLSDEKIQHRRILAEGELKRKLDMLEDNISVNQTWIVGKEMTIADIAIWRGIGWLASDLVAGIPQPYFVNYPKITKIFKNVDNHPKICEWVRKTYPSNYNRGYIE